MLKSVVAGAALVAAALISPHASAVTLYDNLGASAGGSDVAGLNGVGPLYASFSTKGTSFSLSNFNVLINGGTIDKGSYYIAVYRDDPTALDPAPNLDPLTGQLYKSSNFDDTSLPDTKSVVNFAFAPIVLDPNTRYWIGLGSVGDTELIWHFASNAAGIGVASEFWRNAVDGGPNGLGPYQMQIGSEVPLPAALPLFATVLAGGGLIAWRRKRRIATATAR